MAQEPQIMVMAEGTPEHPRHGGHSLIELADGSILMAWMAADASDLRAQAGDDAPFDIVCMKSHDGGLSWDDTRSLVQRGPEDTASYKPSFLRLQNGDILFRYEMYHRFVQNEDRSISAYVTWSRDECETFAEPVTIFSRRANLTGSMNDVRQLSSGRIVVPTERISGKALQEDGEGSNLAPTDTGEAGCFYSDDQGKTWSECENYVYLPMRGASEPKIEQLNDGRLLMVMRTQLGSVFQSHSSDGGRTWSNPQTTGLPAPESCPALLRIPTGDLMLVWNDSPYDPRFDHYGRRNPLSVAISRDEGKTWGPSKSIETDPTWEFTNPAPMATSRGTILIGYEASPYESLEPPGKLGRHIMHGKLAIIDVEWLYA